MLNPRPGDLPLKVTKVKPTCATYNSLIAAYAKKHDVESAERWLAEMLEHNVKADVASYSAVINACARHASRY